MSARTVSPRAVQAITELRAAVDTIKTTAAPTPLSLAIVELFEATARYWAAWLPAEPTAMDRATLALARAIAQTPDLAAGSLPATPSSTTERKAQP